MHTSSLKNTVELCLVEKLRMLRFTILLKHAREQLSIETQGKVKFQRIKNLTGGSRQSKQLVPIHAR